LPQVLVIQAVSQVKSAIFPFAGNFCAFAVKCSGPSPDLKFAESGKRFRIDPPGLAWFGNRVSNPIAAAANEFATVGNLR
jgi:hypothetical protein